MLKITLLIVKLLRVNLLLRKDKSNKLVQIAKQIKVMFKKNHTFDSKNSTCQSPSME